MTLTTWEFAKILLQTFWYLWVIGVIGLYFTVRDTIRGLRAKKKKYIVGGAGKIIVPTAKTQSKSAPESQEESLGGVQPVYSHPRLHFNYWRNRTMRMRYMYRSKTA